MKNLRERRKALGKTLGDIADLIGTSATYVSDAELYPELHSGKAKKVSECLVRLETVIESQPDSQAHTQPPCDELYNSEPCPNPAQSPFTCCLRCLGALSERLYREDKERREKEEAP